MSLQVKHKYVLYFFLSFRSELLKRRRTRIEASGANVRRRRLQFVQLRLNSKRQIWRKRRENSASGANRS